MDAENNEPNYVRPKSFLLATANFGVTIVLIFLSVAVHSAADLARRLESWKRKQRFR